MEGLIQVVTAIKTNFQAGESIEPTVRSFDGPADHAQAAAVRMAAAGDLRSHPQTVQCQAMSTRVVTAVGEESSWSLAWTTDLAFDGDFFGALDFWLLSPSEPAGLSAWDVSIFNIFS